MLSVVSIRCVSADDKRHSAYTLYVDNCAPMQKLFADYEKLYDKTKVLLPTHLSGPPKKKFFSLDAKLHEKRRAWIQTITAHLLRKHVHNEYVQNFYSAVLSEYDQDNVYLGPSESKTAKPDHFDYLKVVGKGSFGQVYLVRSKFGERKIYAMKVLGKDHIKKRNEVQHVMAERNVLISNINHPFLVSLHFSFQNKDKLYFVLDYLNGGELFFHLQREKHFKESRARFYAAEIASALGYLHSLNIIYRDLKPENLLLDKKGHVVLTDFGLCKEGIRPNDTTETFCGTPEYLAPEVILKKPYDRTFDWWCLGTVLYEMLFGLPPFYSTDRAEMYDKIINQKLNISALASPNSRDLLTNLLNKDRTKRLGSLEDFKEIQRHAFFQDIDWAKLERREIKPDFIPPVKDEFDMRFIDEEFTQCRPNPASLVPPTAFSSQDSDFVGFTYCDANNLDAENGERRC
ncbi:hypothetical protein L596_003600 [Steinernema carpocapsae]|uniref:Non-specific serine/threonine protein kinase n=1 Tax=Steinernema carpocapsae TaxID=34508 RepID=A0A4U8UX40_STECR|nr:hypothetical protein L596_003600 [Steinernema carpocapsae]